MVFPGVVPLGKDSQIRQPVVVFTAVDVVDFLSREERPAETTRGDEAVFIDPPLVAPH